MQGAELSEQWTRLCEHRFRYTYLCVLYITFHGTHTSIVFSYFIKNKNHKETWREQVYGNMRTMRSQKIIWILLDKVFIVYLIKTLKLDEIRVSLQSNNIRSLEKLSTHRLQVAHMNTWSIQAKLRYLISIRFIFKWVISLDVDYNGNGNWCFSSILNVRT